MAINKRNLHLFAFIILPILFISGCQKGGGGSPTSPSGNGEQPLPPTRPVDEVYYLPAGRIANSNPYPEGTITLKTMMIDPGRASVLIDGNVARISLTVYATMDLPDLDGKGYRTFIELCDEDGNIIPNTWISGTIGNAIISPGTSGVSITKAVPIEPFVSIPLHVPAVKILFKRTSDGASLRDLNNNLVGIVVPINWHRTASRS